MISAGTSENLEIHFENLEEKADVPRAIRSQLKYLRKVNKYIVLVFGIFLSKALLRLASLPAPSTQPTGQIMLSVT